MRHFFYLRFLFFLLLSLSIMVVVTTSSALAHLPIWSGSSYKLCFSFRWWIYGNDPFTICERYFVCYVYLLPMLQIQTWHKYYYFSFDFFFQSYTYATATVLLLLLCFFVRYILQTSVNRIYWLNINKSIFFDVALIFFSLPDT